MLVVHPKILLEVVGQNRQLMRRHQLVGVPGPAIYIAQEMQRGAEHFGHRVERENVHDERRRDRVGRRELQELSGLEAQGRVVI
ncbi:hypothetical protein D9M72_624660 [compost metagenome]